jgi:hypothetical protein
MTITLFFKFYFTFFFSSSSVRYANISYHAMGYIVLNLDSVNQNIENFLYILLTTLLNL